jgi:hypothetical protein
LHDPNAGNDDLALTITAADLHASRILTQSIECTQQAAANSKETSDAERPDL